MILKIIKSKGLAHNSYFLADGGEALVVDPRRDCIVYTELAKQECVEITYILETHRNEDYVIGSLELQNLTCAEIAHSRNTGFKYGEHNLKEGNAFEIGSLRVEALYTPGHTNDSMCYVLYETKNRDEPLAVFTGDTLFVGNVGRTDLPGLDIWREQSEKLYDSLHQKVLPLGDQVIIYPGHGAGSVCGSRISEREYSTIGYEIKTNPLLQLDKESFIEHMLKEKLLRPPYFRKMEDYNLNSPPLLSEAPVPQSLTVNQFEKEKHEPNTIIVDTREPGAFAGSHIPGSLNIWLDGLSLYPGWTFTYDQRIMLVTEQHEDMKKAKAYLWRLGFDNIIGYLCTGIKGWRNQGKPTERLGTLSVTMLKKKLDQKEIFLVDVREDLEWKEGHIEGSENIFLGYLKEEVNRLPHDKSIATTCGWGGRGGLGASIFKKLGFDDVYNVVGGIKAWKSIGYPLKSVEEN